MKKTGERWVIKSGTDFREFSYLKLNITNNDEKKSSELTVDRIEKYIIDSEVQENEDIKQIVHSYMGKLVKKSTKKCMKIFKMMFFKEI